MKKFNPFGIFDQRRPRIVMASIFLKRVDLLNLIDFNLERQLILTIAMDNAMNLEIRSIQNCLTIKSCGWNVNGEGGSKMPIVCLLGRDVMNWKSFKDHVEISRE
jgi:hypothetical protein